MKKATTIEEQITRLRNRGVEIIDESKAKEILLDIGYYRLGFYFFPFELTYPQLTKRSHTMRPNTKFMDAVTLYYFDFDLRNILMKYISRIEVAFRTFVIYTISNKYSQNPCWFTDTNIVEHSFVDSFEETCYSGIRKNANITRHHKKYPKDIYAPAWKTLEYMTFGQMLALYKSIKNTQDKLDISKHFGIRQTSVFENYMESIRCVRNICAHGSVLYDVKLFQEVRRGPAGIVSSEEKYRLGGTIKVISFLIGTISTNRQHDLIIELNKAYMTLRNKTPHLSSIIESSTCMSWDLSSISKLETIK